MPVDSSSYLYSVLHPSIFLFFFFNDTATTEIYTLSLHDALPILFVRSIQMRMSRRYCLPGAGFRAAHHPSLTGPSRPYAQDRKSTRLNSSHPSISYAVFCLKKKKKNKDHHPLETN